MTPRTAAATAALLILSACAGCAASPPPRAPTLSATRSLTPDAAPTLPEVPSASAYPDALRAAGLPVSVSGRSEELIGSGICGQVRAGRSDAAIASDLTATTWTLAQASTAVRLAHTVLHC